MPSPVRRMRRGRAALSAALVLQAGAALAASPPRAAPPAEAPARGAPARSRMLECGHQWSNMKHAGTATGTWKDFSRACLAQK